MLIEAIAILRDALTESAGVREVAAALRDAQPSMAPLWTATHAALEGHLERFAQRVARAPQAIARFAVDLLETGSSPGATLRVTTLSYSSTVAPVLEALARRRRVEVACSEGRPALEGRRLAARLASHSISVTHYSDAAIGHGLDAADAVLLGADAVTPDWFLNKSGTHMLAALAGQRGVPAYVLAGREKFLGPETAARLAIRSGAPAEVWTDPPPGVTVQNPYFELTPVWLVSAVVTDVGVLGISDIARVCTDYGHI